jgi:hypothetical protein
MPSNLSAVALLACPLTDVWRSTATSEESGTQSRESFPTGVCRTDAREWVAFLDFLESFVDEARLDGPCFLCCVQSAGLVSGLKLTATGRTAPVG